MDAVRPLALVYQQLQPKHACSGIGGAIKLCYSRGSSFHRRRKRTKLTIVDITIRTSEGHPRIVVAA